MAAFAFTAAAGIPLTPPTLARPAPPTDPLRATCRLHGPSSLYTRNSQGYYATFAATCNGCQVGLHEDAENAAADRVRALHSELHIIWATEHGRHTTEHADAVAEHLRAAIATLNEISSVITTPQEYAARTLDAHDAARALDELLVEAAVRDPYVSLIHHISTAMDRLRAAVDPVVVASWPIWGAATETLTLAQDHLADERY
jgi:hypothetical protein